MNLPQRITINPTNIACERQAAVIEAWVCRGILQFWQTALPTDHAVFDLLQARVCHLLSVETLPVWNSELPWISESNVSIPLQNLARDKSLSAAQLFIVALTGCVESTHLIHLAIAELQAPDRSPRLSLHLASAMAQSLFQTDEESQIIWHELNVLCLAQHALIRDHLLTISGDGPLPLQRLSMNPWLWSILLGQPLHWPGLHFYVQREHRPMATQQAQLQLIASLLMQRHSACSGLLLRGFPHSGRSACAHEIARHMGWRAVEIPLEQWLTQPVLQQACGFAGWLPVLRLSATPTQSLRLSQCPVPVVIIASNEVTLPDSSLLEFHVELPTGQERCALWQHLIDDPSLSALLANSALLSTHAIQWIAACAKQIAEQDQSTLHLEHVREARARLGVEKLRLLAQPVARIVQEDALVVPSLVKEGLQLVLRRAHQRESLWKGLGVTLNVTPSPGVRALFVGESGTGKTLAASYIATALAAPLYRVDLSAVMNKYIGESEKNLGQLLDYAAASDVVLLFDEADALFGKRSDGQENGERFANMLTNFLLTRIENHPGVVILTTNSRERIDSAFMRRLDVIVEFSMPDYEERLHLWRSHLGSRGPGDDVYQKLASYCDLAGGQLRNVVLTAAALAGDNTISCEHLINGLRAEYRKQGRSMPRKLEALATLDTISLDSATEALPLD